MNTVKKASKTRAFRALPEIRQATVLAHAAEWCERQALPYVQTIRLGRRCSDLSQQCASTTAALYIIRIFPRTASA